MLLDFNELPDGTVFETDICIIGAGAAGISLAHALVGTRLDICLLESGALTMDTVHQQLTNTTDSAGDYATFGCRLRYFGGSTNHWGGYSLPLTDLDFAKRDWIADSGWPIDRKSLNDWYEKANAMLGAGSFAYTKAELRSADWPYPDIDFTWLDDIYWRIPPKPQGFSGNYRGELEAAENIRIILNATATFLHAESSGTHTKFATIKEPGGKSGRVRARYFVVAAGAMESARLLLASNDVVPDGLGNEHGIVGRYFMMHPHVDIARIVNMDSRLAKSFQAYSDSGTDILPGLAPSESTQRENKILNAAIMLKGRPDTTTGWHAYRLAAGEVHRMYNGWRMNGNPELKDEFGDWVWRALTDMDSVLAGLWNQGNPAYAGQYLQDEATLFVQSEQAPNPDSRVYLSEELDILGMPRLVQDCRVLPVDKLTLRTIGELLGRELGQRDMGRIQLDEWLLDDGVHWESDIWGGCHHMGTTRMSADPTLGVVDADCKLHGVDNTFVASGGVFSTGGYANPTITIVALALRLADHLNKLAA